MFGSGANVEQIRNSICYPNLPVKIAVTHAGISVGEDGHNHQACEDIAIMRAIPNMKVIAPADSVEAEKIVEYLADYYDSPVYLRLARMNTPVVFDSNYKFEFGKGIIAEEGKDVTVISTGVMLFKALEAHKLLASDGISAEIIHMPSIKPIDAKMILNPRKDPQCNNNRRTQHNRRAWVRRVRSAGRKPSCKGKKDSMTDRFAESGEPEALFKKYGTYRKQHSIRS